MDNYVNDFRGYRKKYFFLSDSGKYFLRSNYNYLDCQSSCHTYNTKIKQYPDGSENFFYAPTDLYGREEHLNSFNHEKKSCFSLWCDYRKKKYDLYKMQNEHFKIVHDIDIYYKTADNFLLFRSRLRSDLHSLSDLLLQDLQLSIDERSFVDSLTTTIRHDNLKRAKDSIYDLVYSNDWDYFFTGTFDPEKIDSFSADKIKKPLQKWLNNLRSHYNVSYIIIFEHHKKGGIHIHGLLKEFSLTPLNLVESGNKVFYGFKKPIKESTAKKYGLDWSKGRIVYNLKTWRFGWSTAIKCYGDRGALSHYITKYITKDNEKIMGRYYWHSRDLKRPTVRFTNTDFSDLQHLPIYHGWRFELKLSDESVRKIQTFSDWEDITPYDDLLDYHDISY